MHHKSSQSTRKRPVERRAEDARAAGAGPATGARRRRRRRAAPDLLTHLCEIMKLFPDEGDRALAELVGRMRVDGRAGAAVEESRRAGLRRGPRR